MTADEREHPFLERWMWVWLETGRKPDWFHSNLRVGDLRDLIGDAIRKTIEAKR